MIAFFANDTEVHHGLGAIGGSRSGCTNKSPGLHHPEHDLAALTIDEIVEWRFCKIDGVLEYMFFNTITTAPITAIGARRLSAAAHRCNIADTRAHRGTCYACAATGNRKFGHDMQSTHTLVVKDIFDVVFVSAHMDEHNV